MKRKNLNKILMVSLLSCLSIYGGFKAYNANASPSSQVNVTVPSDMSVIFNEDGTNTISNYNITNNSLVPITVDNINLSSKNGWSIVPSGSKILRDTKSLSLSLFNKWLNEGDNNMSVVIDEGSNKNLSPLVERGAWTKEVKESAFDLNISYNIGKKDFTLSFNPNGGNGVESIVAKNGDSVTLPSATKKGYTFTGWLDSNGIIHNAGSSYTMPIGGDELVAQWRVNKLYIQYNMNGGVLGETSNTDIGTSNGFITLRGSTIVQTFSYGESLGQNGLCDWNNVTHINISKLGYIAPSGAQWNTSLDGTGTSYDQYVAYKTSDLADLSNGDVTLTLYVNWKPIKYTIYFDGNYGNSGSTASMNVDYDSSVNLSPNGFYKSSHTFTNWNTNPYGTGTSYSNNQEIKNLSHKNGDTITLYAQWEPNDISFNFKPENGEKDYNLNGVLGDMYDLTTPIKNGYDFSGWEKSDYYGIFGRYNKNNTFDNGSLGDVRVYRYGYVDSDLYGKVELVEASSDNPTNSKYEAKITATSTYSISGRKAYVGFCTDSSTASEKSYVHTFKAKLPKGTKVDCATNSLGVGGRIVWYSEQYGTGEWETYSYIAELGSNAASSAIGYIFITSIDDTVVSAPFSWNLAYSKIMEVTNVSTDPVLLLGSDNNTLTAKWTPITYNISYNLDGGTVLSNPSSYNVNSETITLSNPVKSGYTFIGWSEKVLPRVWHDGFIDLSDGSVNDSNTNWAYSVFTEFIKVEGGKTYTVSGFDGAIYDNLRIRAYDSSLNYLGCVGKEGLYGSASTGYNPSDTYSPKEDGYIRIMLSSPTYKDNISISTSGLSDSISIPSGSTGNMVYTANWKSITFKIRYNGNGADSGSMEDTLAVYGQHNYLTKNQFKKTGYTFAHWYLSREINGVTKWAYYSPTGIIWYEEGKQPSGSEKYKYVDGDYTSHSTNIQDDIVTAHAQWSIVNYSITYDLDGGTNPDGSKTSYTIGTNYTLPTPSKSGYSFLGWHEFYQMSDWNPGDLINSSGDVTASDRGAYYSEFIPVKAGYTYSWVNQINGRAVGARFYDSNYSYKYYATDDNDSYTPSENGYMRFLIVNYSEGDEDYLKIIEKSPSGYVTSIKPIDIGDRNFIADWSVNSYYLDVNGLLDGTFSNGTKDYGTFDVYINGTLTAQGVDDYYGLHTYGSTYEIKNIVPAVGHTYTGLIQGTLKGAIGVGHVDVVLSFNTNTFTVKYESNGADSGSMGTTSVTYDNPTKLEKNKFVKKGYTFGGWVAKRKSDSKIRYSSTNGSDTGWYSEGQQPSGWIHYIYKDETEVYASSTVDKDIVTMVAKWNINTGNMYYYPNGGVPKDEYPLITSGEFAGASSKVVGFDYNSTSGNTVMDVSTGFIRNGYYASSDKAWILGSPDSGIFIKDFDQDLSSFVEDNTNVNLKLYANWKPVNYSITYNLNGGTNPNSGVATNYTIESNNITLPTPTRTGHTFEGWFDNSSFTGTAITSIPSGSTGNKTYYAKWAVNTYYLDVSGVLDGIGEYNTVGYGTFDVYINGVLVQQGASDYYTRHPYGTSYEIKNIVPTIGHHYVGVHSGSLKGTIGAGHTTVRLALNTNTYNVVYNANGGSGSTATSTHKYGEAKTLTPNGFSKTGYSFAGWATSANGSVAYSNGQSVTNLTATNNGTVNLYAKWTPNTNTKYTVNHYQMNLDGVNYTLKESESKTGTSDSSITVSNLKKTYTGFTYLNGKVGSSVVTTTTVAPDGSRVINLYYSRNKYLLDVGGWFNNSQLGNIPSLGMFDITINGVKHANLTDYCNEIYYGSSFNIDNVRINPGYEYKGFYVGDIGGGIHTVSGTNGVLGANTTYVDLWINTINYSITYNLNGGSISGQKTSYNVDTATFTLPTPSRTGYLFSGWTGSNGSTPQTSVSVVKGSTGNKSYTANWTPKKLTTTFYRNLDSSDTTTTQQVFTYGLSQSFSAKGWSKTGYTQLGWADSRTATTQQYSTLSGVADSWIESKYPSNNIYAIWRPNNYTIAFKTSASGASGTTPNISAKYDTSYNLTPNGFVRPGYTFTGWNTNEDGSGTAYTNGQSVKNLTASDGGTVNLYAQWKPNNYTLTFNANGGSVSPTSKSVACGSQYGTLPTPTRTGYTFTGWFTAASGGTKVSTTTTMGAGNVTVYAQWTANTYTINYNANGGTGTTASSSHTYGVAKALTNNGFSRTGYTFLGWSTSPSATTATYTNGQSVSNLSSTNGATVTLYAVWKVNSYTLTFNPNGGTVSETSRKVAQGSPLGKLPVPTRPGYIFNGWFAYSYGGTQYTESSIMGSSDLTIYARWTQKTTTLIDGPSFNSTLLSMLGNCTKISFTSTAIPSNKISTATVVSVSGSANKAYMYVDGSTVYISPDESNVSLIGNANCFTMFLNAKTVTTLDLSNFVVTTQTTNMKRMFANMIALQSIDVSRFKTDNVTDMSQLFQDCDSLTSLDVSKFNTAKVTTMSLMFDSCNSLRSLTLTTGIRPTFVTTSVTDMSFMFAGCNSLPTVNLSSFNTSKVTNMGSMFNGCLSLTSLNLANFNTSNVTSMSGMFADCRSLASLNLSSFTDYNVTNFSYMFSECINLSNLNISNMGLHKATTVREMFYNCPKLSTTVTVRGNPSNYLYMFKYTATASGSMVSVNYTSSTSALVLSMIDTKSPNSNVTLGFMVYSLDGDSSEEESNESVDGVLKPSDTLPNEQPSEELDNVVSTPQVDNNSEDELVDEPSSNVENGTSSEVKDEPSSDVGDVPSEDVEEIPPTDNAEEIPKDDTIKTPSDDVPIDIPNENIPSGNDP